MLLKDNNLIYCNIYVNVSIKIILKDNNLIYCDILNKCKYKNVTKSNKSYSVRTWKSTLFYIYFKKSF